MINRCLRDEVLGYVRSTEADQVGWRIGADLYHMLIRSLIHQVDPRVRVFGVETELGR